MRVIVDFANPVKVEFHCKGLYILLPNASSFQEVESCRLNKTWSAFVIKATQEPGTPHIIKYTKE